MQQTFNRYWSDAQRTTRWTNAMLAPPPEHVMNILGAAGAYLDIAHRFVNGFADPSEFQHWFLDPNEAEKYLASVASRQSALSQRAEGGDRPPAGGADQAGRG